MYQNHFGFNQAPFSIAPDPRFLFLSESHNEALAHLLYGFTHGGFVLITGEVGTGKTTLLRNLLDKTPADIDVAFILNPRLTVRELLETLCEELGVIRQSREGDSVKHYIDVLNQHLLETHRHGRSTVMIIDEAQNLSPAVLEQIRLLTNLETNDKKLLRIILLGQPELLDMLARRQLRQLSQRITARYHLRPLSKEDTFNYVSHRLECAGGNPGIFIHRAVSALYRLSGGTPRLINIIADRALLGAYVEGTHEVTANHVHKAAREVSGEGRRYLTRAHVVSATGLVLVAAMSTYAWLNWNSPTQTAARQIPQPQTTPAQPQNTAPPATKSVVAEPQVNETIDQPRPSSATDTNPPPLRQTIVISRPDIATFELQRQAFAHIFAAWGNDFDKSQAVVPCDYAPKVGLQCLRRNGSWGELQRLNSPAVIELWDDQPSPYFAAIVSFDAGLYEIVVGDRTYRVHPRDLRDSWFGRYVILWQTPPNYRGSLRQGDEHTTVTWLRNKLTRLDPTNPQGNSPFFDDNLVTVVRAFQQQEGLIADGVVGPLTWIRITDHLDFPTPGISD